MDPLTHALAGAALGWVAGGRSIGRRALLTGAAAALLPDVDVLIRSGADPLLAIEQHRGFTHSLLLVPLGGVLAALPFFARLSRAQRIAAAAAGIVAYASHALLDAATTYGTQLFWPFSRYRVGLDIISIIDPLFTMIVLAGVVAAVAGRRRVVLAVVALACLWLAAGFVQRERAAAAQARLALVRGDTLHRGAVFPTAGNTIVWRSIYRTNGALRMDRIRVPWLGEASYAAVASVSPETQSHHTLQRDLQRFTWFSDGWIARDPRDPSVIGDARYSLHAGRYEPVWGIRLRPGAEPPVEWVDRSRGRSADGSRLWEEIAGRSAAFRPLR